jgi:methylated-DNA-[protein]-cysteine S-methyltransferase
VTASIIPTIVTPIQEEIEPAEEIIMRREEVKTEEDIVNYLSGWPEFEVAVYVATSKIPKGKVSTYKRIAEKIGKPRAIRAVANALPKNPLFPVVPCHRVVKSDGGFGGPKDRANGRRALVKAEGVPLRGGKVVISNDVLY